MKNYATVQFNAKLPNSFADSVHFTFSGAQQFRGFYKLIDEFRTLLEELKLKCDVYETRRIGGTGYNVHIVPVKKLFKESELKSALGFDIAHMAPTEDWWHPTKLVAFCTQLGMVIQRNMEDVGYRLKQESHTYSKAQPAWTAVYYVQKYEQALSKA